MLFLYSLFSISEQLAVCFKTFDSTLIHCHLDTDSFILSSVEVSIAFHFLFTHPLTLNVILLEEYLFVLNSSPSVIPESIEIYKYINTLV